MRAFATSLLAIWRVAGSPATALTWLGPDDGGLGDSVGLDGGVREPEGPPLLLFSSNGAFRAFRATGDRYHEDEALTVAPAGATATH